MAGEIKQTTLCYLKRGGDYLMLHRTKKEHDQNRDKWLAPGGKFKPGESPEDCMKREVLEETGFTVREWRYAGVVTFVSDVWECEMMHIFECTEWGGRERVCDEGDLEWISESEVCKLAAWEGDKIFFRLLQKNGPFFSLKFNYEGERLVRAELGGKPFDFKNLG